MLIHTSEKVPIARLLTFLEHGERLANECAKVQAALAPDFRSRRFLLNPGSSGSCVCLGISGGHCLARAEASRRCTVFAGAGGVSKGAQRCPDQAGFV